MIIESFDGASIIAYIAITLIMLGVWKLFEIVLDIVSLVVDKIERLIYGEPIEPYCLFKIENWRYDKNRIIDRF